MMSEHVLYKKRGRTRSLLDMPVTSFTGREQSVTQSFPWVEQLFWLIFLLVSVDAVGPSYQVTPPKITSELPAVVYYKLRRNQTIRCTATGFPPPRVSWHKDGERIGNQIDYNESTLTLNSNNDIGSYQCRASNDINQRKLEAISEDMQAVVAELKVNPQSNPPLSVTEGDGVRLLCNHSYSVPPPIVRWYYNRTNTEVRGDNVAVSETGELIFSSVRLADGLSTYSCKIENPILGKHVRHPIWKVTLNVTPRSADSGAQTLIYNSSRNVAVEKYNDVNLTCIYNVSNGSHSWYRDGGGDDPSISGFHLMRKNVTENERWVCNSKISFFITVYVKPQFVVIPRSTTSPVGGSHTFHCQANGTPEPVITWAFNSQPLTEYNNSSTMYVQDLSLDDMGVIQCNATNAYGTVTTSAYHNIDNTSSTLALPPEANAVITTTVKHTKKTTPHRTSASTTLAPMSPLVTSKQTYVITDPMTTKQRTLPLEENHSAASINAFIKENTPLLLIAMVCIVAVIAIVIIVALVVYVIVCKKKEPQTLQIDLESQPFTLQNYLKKLEDSGVASDGESVSARIHETDSCIVEESNC